MKPAFTVTPSAATSEFSILLHRRGHGARVIASGMNADQAQHRIEQIAEECGQPITRWTGPDSDDDPYVIDLVYVNESAEEDCGFYVLVEDLEIPED